MAAAIASGSHTWKGNWADLVQAAKATSRAIRVVKPSPGAHTSEASTSETDVVPRRHTISDTAVSSESPPRKVISRVRMEAAWPAPPLRAISRNDAMEVSSQVMNSSTRSSASTRVTIDRVNRAITSEKLSCLPGSR